MIKNKKLGWGCSSVVKCVLSMSEALGSTPSVRREGKGEEGRRRGRDRKSGEEMTS